MSFTLTQYANTSTSTGASGQSLDNNFSLLGVLTPLPCACAGTNTLTFTQQTSGSGSDATSIALAAYENHVQISSIAAQTNSGAVTAQLGSLTALPVYKDSPTGPTALVGGEIVATCSFTLKYDSALNSGNGGWHLIATTATVGSTITPAFINVSGGIQAGSTLSATLQMMRTALATLTFTSIVPNTTQDQTFTMSSVNFGDALAFGFPSLASAGLGITGFIAAAGTVAGSVAATIAVRISNVTANVTITPGAMTLRATAFRCS